MIVQEKSSGERAFDSINHILLILAALLCVLPLLHILAISLSSNSAVAAGFVTFWPKNFTLSAYQYVANRTEFWRALFISVERIALGGTINIFLTVLTAYPLSKEKREFRWRLYYVWFFFLTMLFNGGLIPTYMVVKSTGLLDKIWALILPNAVNVYYIVLMINFFRRVPKELEEAAFIDGAGHWTILWKIFVPISIPSIATIALFTAVGHWNSWFDGLIYMNRPENFPLQSYLQTILNQLRFSSADVGYDWENIAELSDRTVKAAQIFVGSLPILLLYPFVQKFFVKGMALGSVKG